jgi:uncharacterized membrane protein (UPF0127 family)
MRLSILLGFAFGIFLIAAVFWHLWQVQASLASFPIGKVVVGNETWNVYVASTPAQQAQGYMYQHSIGNCNGMGNCLGMLFIMNSTQEICMWMHNTPMPLHQYWIENNTITYSYNAVPFSDKTVCHMGNAVLETNKTIPIGAGIRTNSS